MYISRVLLLHFFLILCTSKIYAAEIEPPANHCNKNAIGSLADMGADTNGNADNTTIFKSIGDGNSFIYAPQGLYRISENSIILRKTHFLGAGKWLIHGHTLPMGDFIDEDIVLHVPSDFRDPNVALGYLQSRTLKDGVTATIKIDDGIYNNWGTIVPNHSQGYQIRIIGNKKDKTKVIVYVDNKNSKSFLKIDGGHALGLIDGLTVRGQEGWVSPYRWNEAIRPYGAAILANNAATLNVGPQFESDKMYYGIRADNGAAINVAAGVRVTNYGDVGYHAAFGGHIDATGTSAENGGHKSVGLGSGYMAESGGTLKCEVCTSTHANVAAYSALSNGVLWALSARASDSHIGFWSANGGHMIASTVEHPNEGTTTAQRNYIGFKVDLGGTMEAYSSLAINNEFSGYSVDAGTIDATNSTSAKNGKYGYLSINRSVIYGNLHPSGNQVSTQVDASSIVGAHSYK